MSRPPASIANTSPPETIGAVSSRRRLASPSPRSTDQISCGTGLSAGLSSRFRQGAVAVRPLGVVDRPWDRDGSRPRGAGRRRLVRPHRDALARQDGVLVAASRQRQRQRQRRCRRAASPPLGPGSRHPRAQPSTATGAGGSIDPPAARMSCRARDCSASVAVGSASSGLQVGDRRRPVARVEMHQRPLLERQRPERGAGRDQPLERRLALGGVHRRAEQHHPLQGRERAPGRRRRAVAGDLAEEPRGAVTVAGRLEAAGLRQPRQHRRARVRRGEGAERLGPRRRVGLGERHGHRVAGRGRRRPLPRLPPGVEGRAADQQQHHRGDQPAIASERGEEPVAADLLAHLADEGITLVHAQRLRAPSAV